VIIGNPTLLEMIGMASGLLHLSKSYNPA